MSVRSDNYDSLREGLIFSLGFVFMAVFVALLPIGALLILVGRLWEGSVLFVPSVGFWLWWMKYTESD